MFYIILKEGKKMKIKMREDCNRHFLMCGRVYIKQGEIKEYDSESQELRELFKRNLIEEVKESSTKDDVESKEDKVIEIGSPKEIEIFERKFDKKAIWRGKPTKAFKKWIQDNI